MLTSRSLKIQSVSELTRSIKVLMETEFPFVTVAGEISNLKQPYSGHLYFTLKDRDAQLRAVLFKQQQRYLDIKPADGLEVVCRGRISLYEPRGEYQLLVDNIISLGAGELQAAFERLKSALAAEGLFDESAKRRLPLLPEKITLVTSPSGAAVHDFIRAAQNRYPGFPIEIFPVKVQGESAATEIVDALDTLNHRGKTDVIVLCRGGGTLEDLWAFNEEKLARAIYASEIPVVSAVGHEIDFTISDFVADLRAPTPTAAAEAVIPDQRGLRERITGSDRNLAASLTRLIVHYRHLISGQERMLGDPTLLLANFGLRLKNTTAELVRALSALLSARRNQLKDCEVALKEVNPGRILAARKQKTIELFRLACLLIKLRLDQERERLGKSGALLNAVSPLAILGRGYAIALGALDRAVIRDSSRLAVGSDVEVILERGGFEAKVTGIKEPSTGETGQVPLTDQ